MSESTSSVLKEIQPRIDPTFRGLVTNRSLAPGLDIPEQDELAKVLKARDMRTIPNEATVMEGLGMQLKELRSPILEVGVGGARAFEQAQALGLDIYGVDIALEARRGTGPMGPGAIRHQANLRNLARLIAANPEKIREADATQHIPFEDNSFKTVIASYSLPLYARTPQEVVRSILEMIRVSRERVVFTAKYIDTPRINESIELGLGDSMFNFMLAQFLEDLNEYGVTNKWVIGRKDPGYRDHTTTIVNAHLDVSTKEREIFTMNKPIKITRSVEDYVRKVNIKIF